MRPATSRGTTIGRLAWTLLLLAGTAHAVVPTAPTSLTATPASTTQINLSWTDTSNNETSFKIERKTNTTAFAQIATVGANVTTFSDTGRTSATTYIYRVRASNASGNSSYTNEASATTQGADTTAPSTPGGFNATPTSTSQVNLVWNASADAAGVTGYRVERCQGTACTGFAQIAAPTATSFSDGGLSAATPYRYRVRATDAAGNFSSYSTVATATTSSIGPVGAWGLNGVAGTSEADYSGNNNRGSVSGAIPMATARFGNALAFRGANSSVDLGNPVVLRMAGSMTVSAWINSAAHPANDAAIVSKRDSGTVGFQLDTTVDGGPRTIGFKLTDASGNTMKRLGATVLQLNQWYHVAGVYDAAAQTMTVYLNGVPDNGALGGTVSGRQLNSTANVFIGRRAGNPVDFNFNGIIDEVRIHDRALSQAEIQAAMDAPIAPPSPDAVAPSAPVALVLSPMSTTQIHLEWTGSSDNFDLTAYRVERCQGAGCSDFAEVGVVIDHKFNDPGLAPASTYRYRVRAADGAGNVSGYSNVATLATLASDPEGGRVGLYPFEEGSGTSTADFSGFGNNAMVNGPAWTSAGKYGNALSFGGGYVDLGNPGTLQITGSMTISAWVNSSAFPANDAAIVSKRDAGSLGYQLDTTVDAGPRTIGLKLTNASGDSVKRLGSTALQLNQWYHVAGVYDAQAQTLSVYLNGQPDNGALSGAMSSGQLDSALNVNIGRRPGAPGFEFAGTIDDVRLYNRALTQAEIQADMAVPASTPVGDTTAPTAPSALSASAAGAGQINLAWTASTDNVGVAAHRVERCQGAGCASFAQIATSVTPSFSDTGLRPGTSYSYRVRANDAAGNLSAYSNVASATTAIAQAQMYFIYTDHLSTPRAITSTAGTTVWRWDQTEAFGDSVPAADPDGDGLAFDFPLRFPGQHFDRETNLVYNYFRDHDAATGRYIESDLVGLRAGLNTYAYAVGSPLIYLDPLGLMGNSPGGPSRPSPYCGPRPTSGCVPEPSAPEPAPMACKEKCERAFETCRTLVDWFPFITQISGSLIGAGIGAGLGGGGILVAGGGSAVGGAGPKGIEGLTGMNQNTLNQGCDAVRAKCLGHCPTCEE